MVDGHKSVWPPKDDIVAFYVFVKLPTIVHKY